MKRAVWDSYRRIKAGLSVLEKGKFLCIATDHGTMCRAPASILDEQRGGMVCQRHAPKQLLLELGKL
jgi:hypothetical protein